MTLSPVNTIRRKCVLIFCGQAERQKLVLNTLARSEVDHSTANLWPFRNATNAKFQRYGCAQLGVKARAGCPFFWDDCGLGGICLFRL